ncbi:uncharacterized protein IL334_005440 [Kwoniella shivajii]|uniref:Rho-GAP domain-containing protein n=1 Tax=Kwoniella shivajii TaxID=564305 RepID=A0ABZ1D574_9TREE|nr:hypothetical protein IL334_005440 [Kwoniella shivajii]
MRPKEHVLSKQVLEFLIEHQDNFLLGMELKKRKEKKQIPTPPPMVKADSDLMLPSDSDDEAPAGGYYVIEGTGRPTSPPIASPVQPNISASLLPAPPVRTKPSPAKPAPSDLMEMSDSDDEAPPGGYEVRTGNPLTSRAAIIAKAQAGGSSIARRKTLPTRRPGDSTASLRRTTKEAP